MRRMDWMPLLSTLTGAVIGIAATLFADRNRWRREETRHAVEMRRTVYTEYASALKDAGEEIRAVALGDHMSDSARDAAVREAFRGTGLHTASEQLWLVGPPLVVVAGNEAFHSVRQLRDAYARGVAGSTEEPSFSGAARPWPRCAAACVRTWASAPSESSDQRLAAVSGVVPMWQDRNGGDRRLPGAGCAGVPRPPPGADDTR